MSDQRHTILFVDQDENGLYTLQKTLRKTPYTVYTAVNGKNALRELELNQFSVIASVLHLPDMDGTDLLKKAVNEQPKAVPLLMPNTDGEDDLSAAAETAAVPYTLNRPFVADDVRQIIQQAVALYEKRTRKHTILFVDDDQEILHLVKLMLASSPYNLITAANGQKALYEMENTNISVVISDLRMPIMDGTKLLHRVKEQYPETIRIIQSAYADKETVYNAVQKGEIWRFMVKPWRSADMINTVQQAVQEYENQV